MDSQVAAASRYVFAVRLVLGLAQGLVLYLLYSAFDQKAWPATEPQLFAPLSVLALFIPPLLSQALGNVRLTTLAIWAAVATAAVAGLVWYDQWHAWPADRLPQILPSPRIVFASAVFLFVAHALISCGDADRRIVARYPTLFDLAWKLGVQAAIAVAFVAVFWIMLWLGVALFDMIRLAGFHRFVQHSWFAIPATALAAAAAIHLTDTRAGMVRDVRTLALTLLSWLLPVIALIALAFLVSLAVTGLAPLWQTGYATALLLISAAVLVIHINAAYQDGDPERRPPHILRVAGTLAAVLLIFFVWIAAYALWLRVDQYGWSVERIYSAACVLVSAVFAVGYLVAALLPGLWLKLIERWNVYATFVFLAVLFALSTPIADPMRIAVASQVARLNSGAVKPAEFDFDYLRYFGGRFGRDALAALTASPDQATREGAAAALANQQRRFVRRVAKVSAEALAKAITAYPAGKPLPASFLRQDWRLASRPLNIESCVAKTATKERCKAVLADLDGDGKDEIIVIHPFATAEEFWLADVFRWNGASWNGVGALNAPHCRGDLKALLDGRFKAVPHQPPLADLEIDGRRVDVATYSRPVSCR